MRFSGQRQLDRHFPNREMAHRVVEGASAHSLSQSGSAVLRLRLAAATTAGWLTGDIEEDLCGISGGYGGTLRVGACRHETIGRDSLKSDGVVPRLQCIHPDCV